MYKNYLTKCSNTVYVGILSTSGLNNENNITIMIQNAAK